MPRINLKSLGMSMLRIYFEARLSEELVKMMSSVSPPDEDGDFLFFDSYKMEGTGHSAIAIVSKVKKGSNDFGFDLIYRVERAGRLSKEMPRVENLFEILSDFKELVSFNCLSRFIFGSRSKINTLVKLPIRVTNQTNAVFNEIHGMHFVKSEKKEIEYEVILDLLEEEGITETVIFRKTDRINEEIIEKLANRAAKISSSFIFKEE